MVTLKFSKDSMLGKFLSGNTLRIAMARVHFSVQLEKGVNFSA